MKLVHLPIFVALAAISAAAQTVPSTISAQAPLLAPRQHHAPIQILERRQNGSVVSNNWSGYAVTGAAGSVSDVKASWTVPTVTCSGFRGQYASFWLGIDGYSSSTVEQTGTDSDCSRGKPTYYAWYEFFPAGSVTISSMTIEPGDIMSAEVVYNGTQFTCTITDHRTSQSFSTSSTVSTAQRSSAEWIAEAPSGLLRGVLPLADFGTVYFGPAFTGISGTDVATIGGTTGAIGTFPSVTSITMVNSAGGEAVPSVLAPDNASFTVAYQ
jgi:hypothetical protein